MAESNDALAAGEVESKLNFDESAVGKVESKPSNSFSIWRPSEDEESHKFILSRLIEKLFLEGPRWTPYRMLSVEEAKVMAKQVEESFVAKDGDNKTEILRAYYKEVSDRMSEVMKAKAGVSADVVKEGSQNQKVEG